MLYLLLNVFVEGYKVSGGFMVVLTCLKVLLFIVVLLVVFDVLTGYLAGVQHPILFPFFIYILIIYVILNIH